MKCYYIQDCAAILLHVIVRVITIIIYFRSALTMPEATYRQIPGCQGGSTQIRIQMLHICTIY
jgi:hypothetical protein